MSLWALIQLAWKFRSVLGWVINLVLGWIQEGRDAAWIKEKLTAFDSAMRTAHDTKDTSSLEDIFRHPNGPSV